jgi:hypothetical protein
VRTLATLIFAAILTPLGVRLALPYFRAELPPVVDPVVDLLVWWTDLLAVPFAADVGAVERTIDFLAGQR